MANVVEIVIKGIDNASGPLGKALGSYSAFGTALTRMATVGAAAAATITGALVALTASAINNADEMGKAAQKAGLGVNEFSKLAYAADLAGVSTEQLGGSLNKLGKALTEAASNPSSEAAQAFAAMGVSVRDSEGKVRELGSVFLDVSDKFATYNDGAEKGALAMKVFGKSGTDIIPLLNSGGEAIRKLGEDIQGVTTESAAQAETFNDNLTKMRVQLAEVGVTLANAVLPQLARYSTAIVQAQKDSNFLGRATQAGADLLKEFALAAFATYTVIQIMAQAIGIAQNALAESWIRPIRIAIALAKQWWESSKQIISIFAQMATAIAEVGSALAKLATGDFAGAAEQSRAAANKIKGEMSALGKSFVAFWAGVGGTIKEEVGDGARTIGAEIDQLVAESKDKLAALAAFQISLHRDDPIQVSGERDPKTTAPGGENSERRFVELQRILDEELTLKQEMDRAYNEGAILDYMTLLDTKRGLDLAELSGRQEMMSTYQSFYMEAHRSMFSYAAEGARTIAAGLSQALVTTILNAKNAAQAFKQLGLSIAQMFLQWIINRGIAFVLEKTIMAASKALLATQVAASAAAAAAIASAWATAAALVSIATYGSAAAVGGSALASTVALAKGLAIGGAFHGGTDYVPNEQSYLLQRGERVVQPSANVELTEFLDRQNSGSSSGGATTVEVFLDGASLFRALGQASKDGRLTLSSRGIV